MKVVFLFLFFGCFISSCFSDCGADSGFYSNQDQECVSCLAGYWCPGDGTIRACAAGTYNPYTGQYVMQKCMPCGVGFYSSSGSASCTQCPTDTTCPAASTAYTQCVPTNKYLGCWIDESTRDLPTVSSISGTSSVDVETCSSSCSGYQYFGVQYGVECRCGSSFGLYGRSTYDSDCSMNCVGNSNEKCGASWKNSIWTPFYNSATFSYLGCYVDCSGTNCNIRDLAHSISLSSVTLESCQAGCSAAGYSFFGVQYGDQCYCGHGYGTLGKAAEADCNMPCNGNSNDICGAAYRNSIYTSYNRVPTGLTYLGCYVDSATRALSFFAGSSSSQTVESCHSACSGYTYFGIQNGDECYCGNSYAAYGSAGESQCSMPCAGNSNEICGGQWRNSVYNV